MKKIFFVVISFLIFLHKIEGQTIVSLFKLLPPSYIDDTIPDNIFQGNKYYPASNDSLDSVVYELDSIDLKRNYLRIGSYFTTGQPDYRVIELRSFKTSENKIIVILSIVGGAHQMLWQNDLQVFDYKNNALTISKNNYLPDSISIIPFLKPATPDSIIKLIKKDGNHVYDFEEDNIKYTCDFLKWADTSITKWQKYNTMEFEWKKNRFAKKMIFEKE